MSFPPLIHHSSHLDQCSNSITPLSRCFITRPIVPSSSKLCIQLYSNIYPFSPIPSCVPIPNRPSNRPLLEHQKSDQSDRGAPECARQSDPGLLGCTRAPVRLNQNWNNWTARAGAGHTKLASQSEAALATRLFATEQSGINGVRLYRRIEGILEEYRETYRNRGIFWTRRIFYSMY